MFYAGVCLGILIGIFTVIGWLFFWHFDDIKRKIERLKDYENR